jgi:hypothetical protein
MVAQSAGCDAQAGKRREGIIAWKRERETDCQDALEGVSLPGESTAFTSVVYTVGLEGTCPFHLCES